ncbi:hypothetical protein [Sphingomonas sp. BAUL-RG-20F-R05-02]|uniref:hypothetical protein n=1 Tax=Sphingomonas sp. BAUL-RG-20F-R05-02 TaxID=2914830 RepID=UPI001F59BC11|nr:hypothetical protein [Sphingomonas sp. BAUL-RG-20F-R05-02]
MIKINGHDLKTSKPSDLDASLIEATGCSSAEVEKLLGSGPDRAARALRPFLADDVLPGGDLAAAIAADSGALDQIRTLYAPAPASEPKKGDA